jgi:hypothetical protein
MASVKQLSLTIKNLQNLFPVCFCSPFAYRKIQIHFLKKRRLFLNCVFERDVNLFIYFLHSFFLSFSVILTSSFYLLYVQKVIVASNHTHCTYTLGRTPLDEG